MRSEKLLCFYSMKVLPFATVIIRFFSYFLMCFFIFVGASGVRLSLHGIVYITLFSAGLKNKAA